jgi:hypothetical protein
MLIIVNVLSTFAALRTEIFSTNIKTLTVGIVDDWGAPPVLQLEDGREIEITFDELNPGPTRYIYKLIHCNADWTPSPLIQSEFMSGFQNLPVDNYDNSFNTTMDYTNYRIYFPNQDVTMKVSGNYAVEVYYEENPDKPVLRACFSVVETEVGIEMSATSNTDIDFNKTHQQVAFDVNFFTSTPPSVQDLKVYVQQNNRRDNMASLIPVLNMQNKKLVYGHNNKLIFDAGNEYRRFEITSTRYNGMGVSSTDFFAPYFHITLFPGEIRAGKSYLYDQDQNGRIFIRSSDATDYSTESDYLFFHFSLLRDEPLLEDVYILSEAFNNILDSRSKMEYNFERKAYEKTELLKQGVYNYLYVTKKNDNSPGNTSLIEGNYFQTENEYTVYIYHRPLGGRYDRLIGVQSISFRP